jgi:hypothetical protein
LVLSILSPTSSSNQLMERKEQKSSIISWTRSLIRAKKKLKMSSRSTSKTWFFRRNWIKSLSKLAFPSSLTLYPTSLPTTPRFPTGSLWSYSHSMIMALSNSVRFIGTINFLDLKPRPARKKMPLWWRTTTAWWQPSLTDWQIKKSRLPILS